jgi:hypothetical protein
MDTFSIETANELFSVFPQWRQLARSEQAEDGTSYLVVEVSPPPEANVEHGLRIDASNGEVTVGFDCYHSHFDSLVGDGEHFGTKAALEFIKQLLSDRVAVISWWSDEKWRGSGQLEAGSPPAIPSWTTATDINRIRVRSWNGLLNSDSDA